MDQEETAVTETKNVMITSVSPSPSCADVIQYNIIKKKIYRLLKNKEEYQKRISSIPNKKFKSCFMFYNHMQ